MINCLLTKTGCTNNEPTLNVSQCHWSRCRAKLQIFWKWQMRYKNWQHNDGIGAVKCVILVTLTAGVYAQQLIISVRRTQTNTHRIGIKYAQIFITRLCIRSGLISFGNYEATVQCGKLIRIDVFATSSVLSRHQVTLSFTLNRFLHFCLASLSHCKLTPFSVFIHLLISCK